MDKLLSILEENQQQVDQCIDAEKLKYIASKISIWDYFSIPRLQYLVLDDAEKSRMLKEYYRKLVTKYFGTGKNFSWFFFVYANGFEKIYSDTLFFCMKFCVSRNFSSVFLLFVGEQCSGSGNIDFAISHAIKDSTKLSITKKIHDGNVETSTTAEKGSSFDKKSCRFLAEKLVLSTATVQF